MTQESIANIQAVHKVLVEALQAIDAAAPKDRPEVPAWNDYPHDVAGNFNYMDALHQEGIQFGEWNTAQIARSALAFVQLASDETHVVDEDDTAILDVKPEDNPPPLQIDIDRW